MRTLPSAPSLPSLAPSADPPPEDGAAAGPSQPLVRVGIHEGRPEALLAAPAQEAALGRPLSSMERAFWLLDQGTRFNGVQILTVRGPISEGLLRAGLLRLQARHPLMRVRIAGDDHAPRFTDAGSGPLPLSTVRRGSDLHWLQIAEEEMNRPFRLGDDHLTRVTLLLGPGRADVVIAHHHVTGDALSIVFAVRDLLRDLSALQRGEPLPPVRSLQLAPPLGRLLPKEARGLHRYLAMNAFLGKYILKAPLRRARRLPCEGEAEPVERRLRLGHRELHAADVAALRERARAEGTSVHAAICAALLLSATAEAFAAELTAGRPTRLGCFTAVNLRDRLGPEAGEAMGNFISQVTTFHRVVPTPPLWALAREVKGSLRSALRWGEHYLTLPMLGLFIPGAWCRDPAGRFIRRFDGASPAALGVTNLASLPIPRDYGAFTLENYQIGVGVSVVGQLLAAVTTFGERMNLNLVFVEPLVSRARAERILDGALARLRHATAQAQAA
ncbi:MAG: hypothetical protein U1A78_26880 [Polyangia bacterium]